MMRLVRGAWKVLVGVKDALVLVFLLLFFGALAAALSARPGSKPVGTGALVLDFTGVIVEQPATPSPTELLTGGGNQVRQYRLRDVVAALDAAATDDRVKTVVLDLDGFLGGGQVALGDVGDALERVRAKKPVLAFGAGYGDDAYQLAAHASEIWLDPQGLVLFAGPGGSRPYFRGLFERVGATVNVYRVGKYKSAVEPFTRDGLSPEAREDATALAGALWTAWQADVTRARPKAQIAAFAGDPVAPVTAAGDLALAAQRAGIIDRIATRSAFDARVAELAGSAPASAERAGFRRIDLKRYIAANPRETGDGAIGVVTVAGAITDGEAGPGTAGGETIGRIIDKAVASGKHKALVVRIDSPGGSALASERIRLSLEAARKKGLPIVVSMGNVAASGGYWIATAGDRVFAEPDTITGSIGIFGLIPTFERAIGKVGITADGVATTPLSGQPDILRGTNPAFNSVIQTYLEAGYRRFVTLVSGARKMPVARVDEIAQGRVWDGGSARQLGLVDGFGGLDEAIAEAARRAKLDPAAPNAVWLDKPEGWSGLFAEMLSSSEEGEPAAATDLIATLARAQLVEAASSVADVERMVRGGSTAQARCLDCPVPVVSTPAPSLVAAIRAWLG